jgi:hypothetical protein
MRTGFTAVHRSLCDVLAKPLNGALLEVHRIPCVFGGGFAQILPVRQKGSRSDIIRANIQCCHVWQKLRVLYLTENNRVRNGAANVAFAEWNGRMSYDQSLFETNDVPDYVRFMAVSMADDILGGRYIVP